MVKKDKFRMPTGMPV